MGRYVFIYNQFWCVWLHWPSPFAVMFAVPLKEIQAQYQFYVLFFIVRFEFYVRSYFRICLRKNSSDKSLVCVWFCFQWNMLFVKCTQINAFRRFFRSINECKTAITMQCNLINRIAMITCIMSISNKNQSNDDIVIVMGSVLRWK